MTEWALIGFAWLWSAEPGYLRFARVYETFETEAQCLETKEILLSHPANQKTAELWCEDVRSSQ
jgi:hypothetical protein